MDVPPVIRLSKQQASHPEYASYTRRLESLEGWPKGLPVCKEEICDAGFVYWNFRDVVTCYYCGQSVGMWEPGDCAYKEHKRWYPSCPFIRMLYQDGLGVNCSNHPEKEEEARPPVPAEPEEEEEARPENPLLCKICYVNHLCVVFMPCRHTVACTKCALNIDTCAVCRHPIEELISIYLQ